MTNFRFQDQPREEDYDAIIDTLLSDVGDMRWNQKSRDAAIAAALDQKKETPNVTLALHLTDLGLVVPIDHNMSQTDVNGMITRTRRAQIFWAAAQLLDELKDTNFDTPEFKSALKYLKPETLDQFNQALASKDHNSIHGALATCHSEFLDEMGNYFQKFESRSLRSMICRPALFYRWSGQLKPTTA